MLGGFSFGTLALSARDIVIYGLAWSMAFVMVGLFEEFLYRGYALYTLGIGLGFWPASILLSALFAGLHLMNAGESIIGALDVMIYSLFACLTLRRTGTLWFAVGLHAAWDFSLTFIYSVPGSGMQATGHLLRSSLQGPTWLTGGSAGPEGSAVGLAVLLVSFCLFPKLFPKT
jgi:membrane protease YdiL (CAAX protease family)